ncbi:Crp/Fnr family transcriptional regulator [Thiomicrorhabdus sp. Milos-T2]|uniref:Crp/Fnr family transcriptional regulator n=1 Tax=Thiomicrorhabdus sp. Milos-T2 TaxID=90814 RepID=UPI0004943D16|nr:cyclic nucleotide-binding domain-containing protein [Thiomicrorhabdus sp. Milos-T2]
MNIAQLISETILGQDVTFEECEKLSTAVTKRSLSAGETLFEAGTKDETLYLLVSGKLDIIKVLGNNNTIHIDTLKPGSMTGELSFIDGNTHTMRLSAKKDSKVLMLHKDAFEELVEKEPMLTYHVMRSILRYSHVMQRKINAKYLEMHRMVQNQYTAEY